MGCDSTLQVSRTVALDVIKRRLDNANTREIEEVLYDLWGQERCYNFRISYGDPRDDEILRRWMLRQDTP